MKTSNLLLNELLLFIQQLIHLELGIEKLQSAEENMSAMETKNSKNGGKTH
jgi:hypothetical protein